MTMRNGGAYRRDLFRRSVPAAVEAAARTMSAAAGNMESSPVWESDFSLPLAVFCSLAAATVNSVSATPVSDTMASVCLPTERVSR